MVVFGITKPAPTRHNHRGVNQVDPRLIAVVTQYANGTGRYGDSQGTNRCGGRARNRFGVGLFAYRHHCARRTKLQRGNHIAAV